jgi:hypothetical protein
LQEDLPEMLLLTYDIKLKVAAEGENIALSPSAFPFLTQ